MGADSFVEGDRRGVPGKDVPLEAGAAFVNSNFGKMGEESSADSLPSLCRSHVEVLEAKAVVAAPGAIAGEKEGETGGGTVDFSDHAAKAWFRAEAVAQEVSFGGDDSCGFAFVEGEFADEAKNGRNVFRDGGADVQGGAQLGFSGVSLGWLSGAGGLSGLSSESGGGAGFLEAGLGWASSHLSKGRVKPKSSCFLPLGSV